MGIVKLGVSNNDAPEKKHAFDLVENVVTGESKVKEQKENKKPSKTKK